MIHFNWGGGGEGVRKELMEQPVSEQDHAREL